MKKWNIWEGHGTRDIHGKVLGSLIIWQSLQPMLAGVGDQTEWTSTHLQHLAAFAPLHFPDRKEMLISCFKMLFWAEVYNASVQRGLYAILNVFEGILTTPVFKYFQVLLPFSDWTLKDCTWSKKLTFPYVSYYLSTQTLHTCNKENSTALWRQNGEGFS